LSPNLSELLGTRVLIGDGAVGTLLGERGVGFEHPYARANLSHPKMVAANCTVGPQRMVEIIGQMADEAGPVAALPNPGLPQLVGGHIRFQRDVDHFAEYGLTLAEAGARLVGGCCGTTSAHVRASPSQPDSGRIRRRFASRKTTTTTL
jgi:methionine synthase I (cobalamin-dependent)